MASSTPESTLEIALRADTSDATSAVQAAGRRMSEALRDVGAAAQGAGDAGAGAMRKLGENGRKAAAEIEKVGEKASMSAQKVRMLAVGFGGMALSAAGSWLGAHGHDGAASYLSGVGGGAMTGASMGFMAGGAPGAVVGGAAGAAFGAFDVWQSREAKERAEAEARDRLSDALWKQLNVYEQTRRQIADFERQCQALTATTRDRGERERELAAAVAERKARDEQLGNAQLAAARDADAERFADLSRERAANAAALSALERLDLGGRDEDGAPSRAPRPRSDPALGDAYLKRGIDLVGGGMDVASEAIRDLTRENLAVARQQLSALNRIASSAVGAAQWS